MLFQEKQNGVCFRGLLTLRRTTGVVLFETQLVCSEETLRKEMVLKNSKKGFFILSYPCSERQPFWSFEEKNPKRRTYITTKLAVSRSFEQHHCCCSSPSKNGYPCSSFLISKKRREEKHKAETHSVCFRKPGFVSRNQKKNLVLFNFKKNLVFFLGTTNLFLFI